MKKKAKMFFVELDKNNKVTFTDEDNTNIRFESGLLRYNFWRIKDLLMVVDFNPALEMKDRFQAQGWKSKLIQKMLKIFKITFTCEVGFKGAVDSTGDMHAMCGGVDLFITNSKKVNKLISPAIGVGYKFKININN